MNTQVHLNQQRIAHLMEQSHLDVIVTSQPEHVFYLTGYFSIAQRISRKANTFAVFSRQSEWVALVVSTAEAPMLALENSLVRPYCHSDFFFAFDESLATDAREEVDTALARTSSDPFAALEAALQEIEGGSGRIGVDESMLSTSQWARAFAEDRLPRIVAASGLFLQARRTKQLHEIERLQRASAVSEKAIVQSLQGASVGTTEAEIAQRFNNSVVSAGGTPLFTVVTIDERAALVDTYVTNKALSKESVIRFDVGCMIDGYCSDIARTAVLGHNSRAEDYYAAILSGENRLVEAAKPGMPANELFELAVTDVRHGIPHYERQHCGHAIGLQVYEPPLIASRDDTLLEEGMVFCIETPYYEIGWGGVQVEDMIEITSEGCRLLTEMGRELIII